MAPTPIRQLLAWSLPSVAVLLSYLWYKKRRIGARSDTGGTKPIEEAAPIFEEKPIDNFDSKLIEEAEPETVGFEKIDELQSTPPRKINRSLSGVETTPIDIVYPRELSKSKSSPVVISDEDLDVQIEKIKSMKTQYNSPSTISAHLSKTPSPVKVEEEKTASPLASPVKESFEVLTKKVAKDNATPKKISRKKSNRNKEAKKMAQKELEEKMSALNVNGQKKDAPKKTEGRRKNSCRDSANHSPSDAMMASPSLSSMSDNHSEGSSDSGKGGSDVATPPPSRTPQLPNQTTRYEFMIPQSLVGKLIGRQGCFVQAIKDKCNANINMHRHPSNNRYKLCSVEGTQSEVDKALKMIRDKFPLKKYSDITLEQVQLTPLIPPTIPLIPDYLYLKLIEGINNDTILSCMVAPNHLFLQQPTHPSFPSLSMLTDCMNQCYGAMDSPLLPSPIPENTVCAALSLNSWYRAIVLSTDEDTDVSYVKFLDYGGYAYVENQQLRQIRQDFMLLPFQAAECHLYGIKSRKEDGTWPEEAYTMVADLTKGVLVYTQVVDYTPEGTPMVNCYTVPDHQGYICLNSKLVDAGFADWEPYADQPLETIPA